MSEEKIKSSFPLAKVIVGVCIFIALAGIASGVYFFLQYQKAQKLIQNPTFSAELQAQDVVGRVGKLMLLPSEQPTVATVSDITKLKDQPFFVNAKNGFKVLIYTNTKEAILYDPVNNKIVNVAPITIGTTPTSTPTPAPKKK